MIVKEVMLSQTETEVFQKFYDELKNIKCGGISCGKCPLAVNEADNKCLIGIIGNIIRKDGYKEEQIEEVSC